MIGTSSLYQLLKITFFFYPYATVLKVGKVGVVVRIVDGAFGPVSLLFWLLGWKIPSKRVPSSNSCGLDTKSPAKNGAMSIKRSTPSITKYREKYFETILLLNALCFRVKILLCAIILLGFIQNSTIVCQ
uniref:Putative uncharacterized membrane protein YMR306C-A n=1 Tax=Saccharomyces cerevisiae (strain ATCC 204508 / S288c) TaxID=559292 RepID=YM306_YEAST|nr:RecName: Full=Putative uncharacterized membrane protein YMR306C-A [Saccharomyces cerevisiae S288C]AHX39339.1 hypothetical protein YMR306C-A [Saccharomyces cerevisiae]